ncbi:MAG TPA: cytochrome c biogenesis protein CcsA [Thermoanaerobaculia bacterium]|nr:cytochrome c biogenesis protein CcsA [Thermoanaerobaculia bacterium]
MDSHLLGWLAVALYVAAEVYAIISLIRPRVPALPGHLLIGAGLLLQFADLEARARAMHSVPYKTIGGSMSLFGWMLGLSYLALLFRHRDRAVGPFLIPFVVLFSILGLLLPQPATVTARPDTRGVMFALHVTFAILGYAAFTFSFVLSLLYLIQNRQLRRVKTGLLFSRLPALDVLGGMIRTSVSIGLSVLGASVVLGIIWAERVWGRLPDAKLGAAILTLIVYGFLLWKDRRGWVGERVALLSILGFALIIFSYTFVNLYFSAEHVFR